MEKLIWKRSCLINACNVFYGQNINEYNIANSIDTVHAEINTCHKVKPSSKKKEIIMCVYRTNKKGDRLMCSKPCLNCLRQSYKILSYKNYKITRFYWFDECGQIQFYNHKRIIGLIS
jgi:hypothetical protein